MLQCTTSVLCWVLVPRRLKTPPSSDSQRVWATWSASQEVAPNRKGLWAAGDVCRSRKGGVCKEKIRADAHTVSLLSAGRNTNVSGLCVGACDWFVLTMTGKRPTAVLAACVCVCVCRLWALLYICIRIGFAHLKSTWAICEHLLCNTVSQDMLYSPRGLCAFVL